MDWSVKLWRFIERHRWLNWLVFVKALLLFAAGVLVSPWYLVPFACVLTLYVYSMNRAEKIIEKQICNHESRIESLEKRHAMFVEYGQWRHPKKKGRTRRRK